MQKFQDKRGFSLVELLVVIAIVGIVLGAIVVTYTGSLRVFTNLKSSSDIIETKTPSIELISRYLDRWGVGVIAKTHRGTCTVCPNAPTTIELTTTNGCSDISFYGNIYGYGFVKSVSGSTANLISCRLSTTSQVNYYSLWRDNWPINDFDGNNNPEMLGISNLNPNNADCSGITSISDQNATMNSSMSGKTVKAGDVIHRASHKIRIYCNNNSNDNGRLWLYVDLTDIYADQLSENASPIAPVDSFNVTPLPEGCNQANGECKALQVEITFRSQSPDYNGQFKTWKITKVFGR